MISSDKIYTQVHTTIPEKYHKYAKNKKLSWSELLTKAIELEMNNDPEIIKQRLEENDREREQLKQHLQQAQQIDTKKKTRLQDLHKGLIPVD